MCLTNLLMNVTLVVNDINVSTHTGFIVIGVIMVSVIIVLVIVKL